jgi:hypothetical protein
MSVGTLELHTVAAEHDNGVLKVINLDMWTKHGAWEHDIKLIV